MIVTWIETYLKTNGKNEGISHNHNHKFQFEVLVWYLSIPPLECDGCDECDEWEDVCDGTLPGNVDPVDDVGAIGKLVLPSIDGGNTALPDDGDAAAG